MPHVRTYKHEWFAEALRVSREELKWSQEELAAAARRAGGRVSAEYVRKLERQTADRRYPSMAVLRSLLEALGTSRAVFEARFADGRRPTARTAPEQSAETLFAPPADTPPSTVRATDLEAAADLLGIFATLSPTDRDELLGFAHSLTAR